MSLTPEQRRRRWRINSITLAVAGILFLLLSWPLLVDALWLGGVLCALIGLLALSAGVAGFRRVRGSAA